ncbi:MAG: methyltransferase domain-containing protein [Candidatus Levybacteria bacterium]|nr:methyltransferase domain-containing protein [Candidatus Levybacteria bacterium]
MKALLRYFAVKTLSEQVDPHKKDFFQKRLVKDSLARYNFASRYIKNKTVLDIACGEGYGSFLLSKKAKNVTGVDVADEIIKNAVEKYQLNGNIKFVSSDAVDFLAKTNKKFDVIISFETVEHVKNYMQFIELLKKCLKPGGTLVLSTPNKRFSDLFFGGTFNRYHLKEFYTREVGNILTKSFHSKPEIYRQRSVSKKHMILSAVKSFIFNEKSTIVKNNSYISGLDNIYVIKSKF